MGVRVAMLLGKVAILLALIVTIFLTFGQCKRSYSHYMVETEDKTGDNKGNDMTHLYNDHDTNKKLLSHRNSNKKSKHEKMKLKKTKEGQKWRRLLRSCNDRSRLRIASNGDGIIRWTLIDKHKDSVSHV